MSPRKGAGSLKKTRTMAATIAEGKEFVDRTAKPKEATQPKPNLKKTRTMQNTTDEAKTILGDEVLADTRAETRRRQAVTESKAKRKPTVKRAGKKTKKGATKRKGAARGKK